MGPTARTRVTLRFTALFATVAIASAAAIYWLIQDNAYRRLNQTLESTLNLASLSLRQEIRERTGDKTAGEAAAQNALRNVFQNYFPEQQVIVYEGGRLVAQKRSLGRRLPELTGGRAATDGFQNLGDMRTLTRHVYVPEAQSTYTVSVGTWRGDVLQDMESVLRALAISLPLALLLAALGASVLAKRTLAPLSQMAATVDAITSKNLEQRVQVVNARDELGQLAIRFNKLLERLEEAFAGQQRFMADAAHELKTPITAALMAAQVTLQGGRRSDREYREALRITEEQMSRMKRLVQNMFLLAQADAHAVEYHPEALYFDEIVNEGCRAMRFLAESKGLHLRVAAMPELACPGDAGLLRQAVIILLDNARKYTPAEGRIEVSVEITDASYLLRIADTGPGIPDSARPYIFDRFYRVDRARSRDGGDGGGAGLGLAIAKWIADRHGGALRLEASNAHGSTFALEIPHDQRPVAMSRGAAS